MRLGSSSDIVRFGGALLLSVVESCSAARNNSTLSDSGSDDVVIMPSDSNFATDTVEAPGRLELAVSAHRVFANRTFAVIGYVRTGARLAVGQEIQLSVSNNGTLANGPHMQTICSGNGPVGSFEERNSFLSPSSITSQIGQVVVTNTQCPNGYQDTGLKLALVHSTAIEPPIETPIVINGTTYNRGQVLNNTSRIELTPNRDPGNSLFFADTIIPTQPSPGEYFSVVFFPQSTYAYGLPCMPSSAPELDTVAGCTVATNANRLVPRSQSLAINQAMPVDTAGALIMGAEMSNVTAATRGIQDNNPLAFTHLGGGAYLMTLKAGTRTTSPCIWRVDLYTSSGTSLDRVVQRVSIN